jgi:hypothetical protein
MLTTIITLALIGQTPAPAPAPRSQVQQQTVSPPRESEYQAGIRALVAKKRARRTAENAARATRAQAQAEADYKAQVKTEAEYKAALPFLLENQRQQLERMSALERNAALRRMAAASEQISRAITLDVVARQNARMGYNTPALDYPGPGAMPYGPYGAVIIQPQQPAQMAAPYANMGFPN